MMIKDACLENFNTIYKILDSLKIDYLPANKMQGRIMIEDEKIIGFYCVEIVFGFLLYVNHFWVEKKYRKPKIIFTFLNDLKKIYTCSLPFLIGINKTNTRLYKLVTIFFTVIKEPLISKDVIYLIVDFKNKGVTKCQV